MSEEAVEGAIVQGISALIDGWDLAIGPPPTLPGGLGAFFLGLLSGTEGWSPYHWIDDALPEWAERVDSDTVRIGGTFIPADDRGHQWVQPFRATFRRDPSRTRLLSYEVRLCDAAVGMDAVPYGSKRPRSWPDPADWLYSFDTDRPAA